MRSLVELQPDDHPGCSWKLWQKLLLLKENKGTVVEGVFDYYDVVVVVVATGVVSMAK